MSTSDKELLSSGLLSVKHMTMVYNETACQTDDPQLARELCEMVNEEHNARIKLFEAMRQRGWYNPQLIDEQQLRQSQQKLQQQMQQQMQQMQQSTSTQFQQPQTGGWHPTSGQSLTGNWQQSNQSQIPPSNWPSGTTTSTQTNWYGGRVQQ